jgi:glycine cleavage system H protein
MADANYPEDLLYHPEHDWARIDADAPDEATLGITWYAQSELGDVVFLELPAVGATVSKDTRYADVESTKAVSEVIAPLSGEVIAVNDALSDDPRPINEDPYGEGWLVRLRMANTSERDALMDSAAYVASLGGG